MNNENTDFIDIFLNSSDIEQETENELLNYALHYARCGFPVIQLQNLERKKGRLQCSCRDGANCSTAGKHPRTRNGSKDATTDENIILDWWEKQPNANIGLLTGIESGFFVLDIDIRTENYPVYNGETTLEELRYYYQNVMKDYAPFEATLTAFSGSGCRHLYFKYPLDQKIKNSASEIAADFGMGLDIKSDDNYIIAPPSNHKSGNKYKWFGSNTPIEDAPKWLIYECLLAMKDNFKEVNPPATNQLAPKPKADEKIPVGQRNNYIFRIVCGLLNTFPKEEVTRRALEINKNQFIEPMKERDILRIIDWSFKKYKKAGSNDMTLKK